MNRRTPARASWLVVALVVSALGFISTAGWAQDKKKKSDDDLEFQPDEVKRSPPSKILARATQLYDEDKYESASIEFKKVLDGETEDTAANRQRAEFFMGKTLYQMKFYAAALSFFDRIVQAGTSHRYHGATLKWLAALSRVLPETSGILEKIGTYDPQLLEQPIMKSVRDELFYLLGRHFYRRGEFDQAISLFNRVTSENAFFIKAKFFQGVTHVRKYEGKPAIDAFKEILVIGRERPKDYTAEDIKKYEELATLAMARVFYSTTQYDTSIKYYEKLTQSSPDWLDSLFEASWAYFMKTNYSKALGNVHTLNAPYFEDFYFPESTILSAVIYYKYCLYDRALESVGEFDAKYRPLRDNIKQILDKYEDNAEFYEYVKKIKARQAGIDPDTERLVLSALGDRTLRKTFNWVDELDSELKALAASQKAWQGTKIASEVLQELTLQKSLAEADAGKLARERIDRLHNELREFSRDTVKVKIEVLNAQAGQISAKAQGERIASDHKEERIVIDDEHFMWKFNGEYWKDELGYYRFKIRSKCPKGGAPVSPQ